SRLCSPPSANLREDTARTPCLLRDLNRQPSAAVLGLVRFCRRLRGSIHEEFCSVLAARAWSIHLDAGGCCRWISVGRGLRGATRLAAKPVAARFGQVEQRAERN